MNKILLTIYTGVLVSGVCTFADFTIGVIPDTQIISQTDKNAKKINKMINYFVDNKDKLNVIFVIALGDMTQNYNDDTEWSRLKEAYSQLIPAGIPFAPMQGNHDGVSGINKTFPVSDFEDTPTWGGSMNGGIENAYYMFSAEGNDFILVIADWDGGNKVTNWANNIFSKNLYRRGIFGAHELNQGSAYETGITTQNNNIFLTVSGHRAGLNKGREENWITKSPDGSIQYNCMTDYQGGHIYNDGGATIRYYTFKTAENRIEAYTWNTTNEVFEIDSNSQFSMDYNMNAETGINNTTGNYMGTTSSETFMNVAQTSGVEWQVSWSVPLNKDFTITMFSASGRNLGLIKRGAGTGRIEQTKVNKDLAKGIVFFSLNTEGKRLISKVVRD